jgi:hypothetical protein
LLVAGIIGGGNDAVALLPCAGATGFCHPKSPGSELDGGVTGGVGVTVVFWLLSATFVAGLSLQPCNNKAPSNKTWKPSIPKTASIMPDRSRGFDSGSVPCGINGLFSFIFLFGACGAGFVGFCLLLFLCPGVFPHKTPGQILKICSFLP